LRAYNISHKIMLDTYTGREGESLEALKIYPMRTLALEEKGDEDMFEEYNPDEMEVKINKWRRGLVTISEEVLQPFHLRVRKDMLMSEFLATLSQKLSIPADNLVVMKRNPMLQMESCEIVSADPTKKLNALRVNEGVNLFVEDKAEKYPLE